MYMFLCTTQYYSTAQNYDPNPTIIEIPKEKYFQRIVLTRYLPIPIFIKFDYSHRCCCETTILTANSAIADCAC